MNLYIDFDGVIMDTISSSYKMMEEEGIDPRDFEKTSLFYQKLDWNIFLEETNEIHDAFEEIEEIVSSELFNVNILTHVNSLHEAEAKIRFLRKKVQDITIIVVPKSVEKTKMVNAKDAILIDDYTDNLRKWEKAGGIGVRFSLKLNGKGFYAIDHLRKIIDFAKEEV